MADILKLFLEISTMASVMIGIVLVIRRVLAKKMNPAVMLALWGMVLLRLMLPFTLTSPVSFDDLLPEKAVAVSAAEETTIIPDQTTTNQALDYNYSGLTEGSAQAETPAVQQNMTQSPETTAVGVSLSDVLADIPWWSVLAAVWIAGMAATLYFAIHKAVRFRKKLRFCRPVADKAIFALIQRYKKDIGIKRGVSVIECDFVSAPAVFGYFKPCILIPSRFINEMGRNSLGAILLHEIYHIRCHDILMNYVWLAAKALHWFNPLVWLAYKWFQDDVEVRRDQKVARMLKKDGAFVYSQSLLEAARFARETTAVTALAALFGNKGKLKERVVRLVKPHRKSKSAAVISALLALIMAAACFTTACQPTPEVEVVVGRQEDVLESVQTVEPDDFEPYEAPEHVSEVYDDYPYLSITYDADVVVPETTAYPITEMSKREFTEEDMVSFIDLFIDGDYEMYAGWSLTKDDYLSLLTKVKEYEGTERVTDDNLNYLQELYEQATNDVENTQISSLSELPENRPLNIKNEDNIISRFMFDPNGLAYYRNDNYMEVLPSSMTDDSQYEKNMDGDYEHFAWRQPGQPDISQEDAYAIALEYMDKLGIDLDLYAAEKCSFIKDFVDKTTGWQFTFMRRISNLRAIDDTGGLFMDPKAPPSYGSPWGQEQLTIAVDKNGLFSLWWRGASELSHTVTESAQLEDFDTIQQRITNQLNYLCATWGENQGKVFEINITKIELGISLLSVKDQTDIGEYIPTWYVTYSCKFEGEDSEEIQQIMFSAIDGSYVEPRVTNEDIMEMTNPSPVEDMDSNTGSEVPEG